MLHCISTSISSLLMSRCCISRRIPAQSHTTTTTVSLLHQSQYACTVTHNYYSLSAASVSGCLHSHTQQLLQSLCCISLRMPPQSHTTTTTVSLLHQSQDACTVTHNNYYSLSAASVTGCLHSHTQQLLQSLCCISLRMPAQSHTQQLLQSLCCISLRMPAQSHTTTTTVSLLHQSQDACTVTHNNYYSLSAASVSGCLHSHTQQLLQSLLHQSQDSCTVTHNNYYSVSAASVSGCLHSHTQQLLQSVCCISHSMLAQSHTTTATVCLLHQTQDACTVTHNYYSVSAASVAGCLHSHTQQLLQCLLLHQSQDACTVTHNNYYSVFCCITHRMPAQSHTTTTTVCLLHQTQDACTVTHNYYSLSAASVTGCLHSHTQQLLQSVCCISLRMPAQSHTTTTVCLLHQSQDACTVTHNNYYSLSAASVSGCLHSHTQQQLQSVCCISHRMAAQSHTTTTTACLLHQSQDACTVTHNNYYSLSAASVTGCLHSHTTTTTVSAASVTGCLHSHTHNNYYSLSAASVTGCLHSHTQQLLQSVCCISHRMPAQSHTTTTTVSLLHQSQYACTVTHNNYYSLSAASVTGCLHSHTQQLLQCLCCISHSMPAQSHTTATTVSLLHQSQDACTVTHNNYYSLSAASVTGCLHSHTQQLLQSVCCISHRMPAQSHTTTTTVCLLHQSQDACSVTHNYYSLSAASVTGCLHSHTQQLLQCLCCISHMMPAQSHTTTTTVCLLHQSQDACSVTHNYYSLSAASVTGCLHSHTQQLLQCLCCISHRMPAQSHTTTTTVSLLHQSQDVCTVTHNNYYSLSAASVTGCLHSYTQQLLQSVCCISHRMPAQSHTTTTTVSLLHQSQYACTVTHNNYYSLSAASVTGCLHSHTQQLLQSVCCISHRMLAQSHTTTTTVCLLHQSQDACTVTHNNYYSLSAASVTGCLHSHTQQLLQSVCCISHSMPAQSHTTTTTVSLLHQSQDACTVTQQLLQSVCCISLRMPAQSYTTTTTVCLLHQSQDACTVTHNNYYSLAAASVTGCLHSHTQQLLQSVCCISHRMPAHSHTTTTTVCLLHQSQDAYTVTHNNYYSLSVASVAGCLHSHTQQLLQSVCCISHRMPAQSHTTTTIVSLLHQSQDVCTATHNNYYSLSAASVTGCLHSHTQQLLQSLCCSHTQLQHEHVLKQISRNISEG